MKAKFEDDFEYVTRKPKKKFIRKYQEELDTQKVEELAKKLIQQSVDYKNIFGYELEKNNIRCISKWNKQSEVFVCYKKQDNTIIETRQKTYREFNCDKAVEYIDEITK